MMKEYAKLPTVKPNGDVSAVAAGGHPLFVRSFLIIRTSEGAMYANRQMRRLKFLVFFVASLCPSWHRVLRRQFGRVDPRMACAIRSHRVLVDVAFLTMIPLETMAELFRMACCIPRSTVDQLSTNAADVKTLSCQERP